MERKLHISIRKAKIITRACGVVGSASALQAEGHRFDSGLVHSFCQKKTTVNSYRMLKFPASTFFHPVFTYISYYHHFLLISSISLNNVRMYLDAISTVLALEGTDSSLLNDGGINDANSCTAVFILFRRPCSAILCDVRL